MVDLHLPNFITIGLISILAILGFQYAMGITGFGGNNQ